MRNLHAVKGSSKEIKVDEAFLCDEVAVPCCNRIIYITELINILLNMMESYFVQFHQSDKHIICVGYQLNYFIKLEFNLVVFMLNDQE